MLYEVWVKRDARWSTARVAGRAFEKRAAQFVDSEDAHFDEICASPLLEVREVGALAQVTDAARELAEERGVDLAGVRGTGRDGKILVRDVGKCEG